MYTSHLVLFKLNEDLIQGSTDRVYIINMTISGQIIDKFTATLD